jgi:predicted esterase YcpF (UPF0227 family)
MDPNPQKLMQHLKKNYPNAYYHSTYEAGFCGFWAHRALCKLGINNIVVNPADVPTTHKEKTQKRDKRDSRKLARELADGSLEAIYIPTHHKNRCGYWLYYWFNLPNEIDNSKAKSNNFCIPKELVCQNDRRCLTGRDVLFIGYNPLTLNMMMLAIILTSC